jgi:outer membrane protein OmpA-like peptidoglycan-associated protein
MKLAKFLFVFLSIGLLGSLANADCPKPRNLAPCGEYIDAVTEDGVQVIARGDTLRLILPADQFFEPASTAVKENRDLAFQHIAQLLNCRCYAISTMRVWGYSDNVGKIKDQQKRSLQQARNVAAYLWSNGIALERMHIRGFGPQGTLSSNATPDGSADNRRVEILLP